MLQNSIVLYYIIQNILKKNIISGFFKHYFLLPLLPFLKQGITPEKLSLTVTFGFTLGTIPIFAATTIFCLLSAFIFRLNKPAILLINLIVYPLQIILYIPFIKLGELIFNYSFIPFSFNEIIIMFKNDWIFTIQKIWFQNLLGIFAWLIISIPFAFLLYYSTLPIFKHFIQKEEKN